MKENAMSYPTILVHIDDSKRAQRRIDVAASIARTLNAHLIGAASTGMRVPVYPTGLADPYYPDITASTELAQQRLQRALSVFDAATARIGVSSFETRMLDGEPGAAVSMLARHCDLAVVGQASPDDATPEAPADLPEYVLLHCGRPVLVVPNEGQLDTVADRPLVAWDASAAAARAIASAMPMLRRAAKVEVVMIHSGKQNDALANQSLNDISLSMARHGVNVSSKQVTAEGPVGPALLKVAAELGSDLIVMGAYGHWRFREILLGGVTRSVLASMTVSTLMSH